MRVESMNIGQYCREYRKNKGVKLAEITGDLSMQTLSAFENGRSSNINHFMIYVCLSCKFDDSDNFLSGFLRDVICNGIKDKEKDCDQKEESNKAS